MEELSSFCRNRAHTAEEVSGQQPVLEIQHLDIRVDFAVPRWMPTLQSSGAVTDRSILTEHWEASFNGNVKE